MAITTLFSWGLDWTGQQKVWSCVLWLASTLVLPKKIDHPLKNADNWEQLGRGSATKIIWGKVSWLWNKRRLVQSSITPRYKAASGGWQGMAEWLSMWGRAKQNNIPYFFKQEKSSDLPVGDSWLREICGKWREWEFMLVEQFSHWLCLHAPSLKPISEVSSLNDNIIFYSISF